VPETSAFHQLEDFLRQILGMISRALKSLSDEEQICTVFPVVAVGLFEVAAENRAAGFVNARVSCERRRHRVGGQHSSGEVEDIIDELQQMASAVTHVPYKTILLICEMVGCFLCQEIREADDRIQGCPKLVAHAGEEMAL